MDATPRKGVVLDFTGTIRLWAQYANETNPIEAWEIVAADFLVELDGAKGDVTLHPIAPRTRQEWPTQCQDCIDATGVSISVRNLFDPDRIEFRVNDPNGVLPRPFPVFTGWTKFWEDEWQY